MGARKAGWSASEQLLLSGVKKIPSFVDNSISDSIENNELNKSSK